MKLFTGAAPYWGGLIDLDAFSAGAFWLKQ